MSGLSLRGDAAKIEPPIARPELTPEERAIFRALKRLPIRERVTAYHNLRTGKLVLVDGRLVPPATRAKR